MAAAKKPVLEIKLPFVKSTPGTHAFGTKNEGALVRSLYVQKEAFPDGPPSEITVTVSV